MPYRDLEDNAATFRVMTSRLKTFSPKGTFRDAFLNKTLYAIRLAQLIRLILNSLLPKVQIDGNKK